MRVSIGFSTSDFWVSRVIKFFTHAPCSHAYIVFDDEGSGFGNEIYEAAWCGFRISTRGVLTRGTTKIVQEIPVDIDPAKALDLCRQWAETPYDYAGLLGEAWVQIGKLFGKRWDNPLANVHHMFCSEAATYLLQHCSTGQLWLKMAKLDARKVDPYMLLEVLTSP
jgi:hypothetical protein